MKFKGWLVSFLAILFLAIGVGSLVPSFEDISVTVADENGRIKVFLDDSGLNMRFSRDGRIISAPVFYYLQDMRPVKARQSISNGNFETIGKSSKISG